MSGHDGYPWVTVSTIASTSTPRLTATARREQLLDVALGVFARSGYHDASMNDIADAAGVTKPVLYQHFDSKRELYQALLDEVGARLLTAIVTAAAEATDGREQTERGFQAYFRWVAEDHDAFMLLYGGGDAARRRVRPRRAAGHRRGGRAVAPLIAADIDDEHRLTLAHALVGLAEGASRRLVERGDDFDPDLIARQVSDLAWAGLRAVRRLTPCTERSAVGPSARGGRTRGLEHEPAVAVDEAGGLARPVISAPTGEVASGSPSTLRISTLRSRPARTWSARASAHDRSSSVAGNVTRWNERRSYHASGTPSRSTTNAAPVRAGCPAVSGHDSAAPYGWAGSVAASTTGAATAPARRRRPARAPGAAGRRHPAGRTGRRRAR